MHKVYFSYKASTNQLWPAIDPRVLTERPNQTKPDFETVWNQTKKPSETGYKASTNQLWPAIDPCVSTERPNQTELDSETVRTFQKLKMYARTYIRNMCTHTCFQKHLDTIYTLELAQVNLNILCSTHSCMNKLVLDLLIYSRILTCPIYVGYFIVLFFPFFSSNFTPT